MNDKSIVIPLMIMAVVLLSLIVVALKDGTSQSKEKERLTYVEVVDNKGNGYCYRTLPKNQDIEIRIENR